MKKKLLAIGIAFFLSIIQSSTLAQAQTKVDPELEKKIEENYLKLQSADFNERYWASYFFSQLKKEELPQKVMDKAIDLFMKEIERIKVFSELLKKPGRIEDNIPKELLEINRSEMHAQYFGYLCKIVGKSGDLRVLPLLVDYHLDSSVLIDFGELAVEPVINVLKTSNNDTRKMGAISVLKDFLKDKEEGYVASGEMREKIKKVLIDAVSDKDMWTRSAVVLALGDSGDRDFIPILEKVAESDPYQVERKPIPGRDKDVPPGKKVIAYPVREDAKEALEKLKGKKN
jgi:hypothetical protein